MRRSGFTLLELIIAVAITALVMAMIGGILISTLEADQRVHDALSTEKAGYGVLSLVRRDLEACYSYALGGPAFKGEHGTEGAQADRIYFVTATEGDPDPQSGRRPKFQRVGYKLKQDAQGQTLSLYRYAEPYTSAKDDPLAPGAYAFVAANLKSFKLSYLDGKDKTWHDSDWTQTDRVPLAVKITVELAPSPEQAQQQQQPSSFGLSPASSFEATVAIATMFAPTPDQDPNAPPK